MGRQTSSEDKDLGNGIRNNAYIIEPDVIASEDDNKQLPSELGTKTSLAWKDIRCTVLGNRITRRGGASLLKGVTGRVESGSIQALMGPSGSGKTTLLDTLADRVASLRIEGKIIMNGIEIKSHRTRQMFRNRSCYVDCNDSFYEIFTIEETMMFTACLALKDARSRKPAVNRALGEVGLDSYRHGRIGGAMFRGLSTGQKRRLSIALELLKNPSILFLDEPLSGLDNYGANEIMKSLTSLARKNKIIILSVHQPPDRVWASFDSLTLLSDGLMLYSGPIGNAVPHFQSFFRDQKPMNLSPGDYILDHINLDFEENAEKKEDRKKKLEELSNLYQNSGEHNLIQRQIADDTDKKESGNIVDTKSFHAGFFPQCYYLTQRALYNNLIHPGFYWAKLFSYILLDVLIGSMYFRSNKVDDNYVAAMIYFVQSYLVILTTAALPCLILIRPVFLKERSNGLIDVLPYIIATLIAMAPWVFGAAIGSAIILYFMVELSNLWWLIAILSVTIMCAESMINLIASLTDQFIVGLAIATGIFGAFMINAGFILPYYLIPDTWYTARRAIYHISFHKYSLRSLLYNEFRAPRYFNNSLIPINCPDFPLATPAAIPDIPFNVTTQLSALGEELSRSVRTIVPDDALESVINPDSPMIRLYRLENVKLEHDLAVLIGYTIAIQVVLYIVTQLKHTGRR